VESGGDTAWHMFVVIVGRTRIRESFANAPASNTTISFFQLWLPTVFTGDAGIHIGHILSKWIARTAGFLEGSPQF
jgi:hypothetical protein